MHAARLILYHKQATSARTRFLRFRYGGVCGPDGLPADVELQSDSPTRAAIVTHPAMLLRAAEVQLSLPRGELEPDAGFHCRIVSGGNASDVFLAHFTAIDPPFDAAAAVGAAFIDLTQARGLPTAELSILRLAYEHVLG